MTFQEKIIQMKRLHDVGEESYKTILNSFNGLDRQIAMNFLLNFETYYAPHEKELEKRAIENKSKVNEALSLTEIASGSKYTAFFDGACYPKNPNGKMGWSAVVLEDGVVLKEFAGFAPEKKGNTNNVAEYFGFMEVLNIIKELGLKEVHIMGDSKLVVDQINLKMRFGSGMYAEAGKQAQKEFKQMSFDGFKLMVTWVSRELNDYADKLSKSHG